MPPSPVRRLDQNLLSMRCSQLLVETVWEDELSEEKFATLFEGVETKPRHIGLAPGYTSVGRLTVLAVAIGSNVSLVRFRNNREGKTLSATLQRIQDALLCNTDNLFYAFDMGPLALSLYIDQRLRITGAIDVQCGCTAKDDRDRDVANAVQFAVKGTSNDRIHRENIVATFKDQVWDERKTANSLAFRAWLAGFLPSVGDMELRFAEVPRINTLDMSDDKLQVLAQFMRSDQRLNSAKSGAATKHEFSPVTSNNNKFKLRSERFQTRVYGNEETAIEMAVTDRFGARYTITGHTQKIEGRTAVVKTGGIIEGKVVNAVTSIGPGGPTAAERQKVEAILAVLQGESAAFEGPFLRTIFPDGKEVVWPEDMPAVEDTPPITFTQRPLNASQEHAVLTMLSLNNSDRITLIQGPPGTGKTTVITAFVHSACAAGQEGLWLIAQSNVAVKNIAEKLETTGFDAWKLLVSKDFHFDWHEHLYKTVRRRIIRSDEFRPSMLRELEGCKVILCTLSMLSHPKIELFTGKVPVRALVVDEASQIALGDYVSPLKNFSTIQKLCFIGDDKQLPPYGQEEIQEIQSIFEVSHLRSQAKFLNIQYRMPIGIGEFISDAMYDGQLCSSHPITTPACWFVDVNGSNEKKYLTSWENKVEREAVCKIAAKMEDLNASYRIITPYDAQRTALENDLKAAGLDWHNKCYNVDSFQGNEEDHIIISLVRSKELGFLKDLRRTNVMLSRCKKAMYVCSSWDFLVCGKGATSLVGKMAASFGDNAWCTVDAILDGDVEVLA